MSNSNPGLLYTEDQIWGTCLRDRNDISIVRCYWEPRMLNIFDVPEFLRFKETAIITSAYTRLSTIEEYHRRCDAHV